MPRVSNTDVRDLPTPRTDGAASLEATLLRRHSQREFTNVVLTERELSQLLWAGQGENRPGRRTAPSAGALYPLELYVATSEGLFRYLSAGHLLEVVLAVDVRQLLAVAALNQPAIAQAPAVFIVTGIAARTEPRYGDRAERYVLIEAGHASQNILLQAVALDLAAVTIAAFRDQEVADILQLPTGEAPIALIPVGHSR